jgi:hypothetical protein
MGVEGQMDELGILIGIALGCAGLCVVIAGVFND